MCNFKHLFKTHPAGVGIFAIIVAVSLILGVRSENGARQVEAARAADVAFCRDLEGMAKCDCLAAMSDKYDGKSWLDSKPLRGAAKECLKTSTAEKPGDYIPGHLFRWGWGKMTD